MTTLPLRAGPAQSAALCSLPVYFAVVLLSCAGQTATSCDTDTLTLPYYPGDCPEPCLLRDPRAYRCHPSDLWRSFWLCPSCAGHDSAETAFLLRIGALFVDEVASACGVLLWPKALRQSGGPVKHHTHVPQCDSRRSV